MDFQAHELDAAIYDEMLRWDGAPREHNLPLHETLSRLSDIELGEVQERVSRSFLNKRITFTEALPGQRDRRKS